MGLVTMASIDDVSVMASDLDRRPATWVARQAVRRQRLVWLGLAVFFLLDGLVLALAVRHRLSLAGSAFFLAFVFAVKPHAEAFVDRTLNWIRGAGAEQAVGETLNELRSDGWVVIHDLEQAGEGNIDHLVSGPNGVYLVETKQRRYEDGHLVKAKRQAAKVHDQLAVWVTPVICLHERRGEPFRTHGVWVVPEQHLLGWLRAQHNRTVGPERLAYLANRLRTTDA
jgi:hypothetical protein